MASYIENPKDCTKQLLELKNEFSEVSGFKIDMRKSVVVSYSKTKLSEKGSKESNPIYNGIKNNKILRNKFNEGSEKVIH